MAKNVISFKLEGNGSLPDFLNSYPISEPLSGISCARVKYGNRYLGISVDDSVFWLPKTVQKFTSIEECSSAVTDIILLVPTYNEEEGVVSYQERTTTSEEKLEIITKLFSLI